MKKLLRTVIAALLLIAAMIACIPAAFAQSNQVFAVLFYSPGCGHCTKVMTEDLPPLQQHYGERLIIYTVDISSQEGHDLFEAALERYQGPDEPRGVPMMVVGDTVLVGSREIPQEFPALVESTLAETGSDLPDIPGLDVNKLPVFGSSQKMPANVSQEPEATLSPVQTGDLQPASSNRSSVITTFMQDPPGNTLAVILLAAMTICMIWAVWSFLTRSQVGGTRWSVWAVPVLTILGLFVAAYLTYIETTHTQAVCGPIGNCNAVQQSPYAYVLGIIPVGMLGLVGYALILATWIIYRGGPGEWRTIAAILCWGMVWFGMIFSFYLTFLEPFVIGATCAWCITSAAIMTLLLLATTGPVINALNPQE